MRTRAYVKVGSIRLIANAALAIGLVGGVGGIAYAVNGGTRAGAPVTVPAHITGDVGVDYGAVPFAAPGLPAGSELRPRAPEWVLSVPDSTVAEQLLARGDSAVIGLAVLAGTFLLRGLLLSIADGRPFERGNARRLAGIAGLVAVGTTVGPALPDVAAGLVLDRVHAFGDAPYAAQVSWPLIPLLFVPVLLALAEAFRRGAELDADVAGLV